jgi:hypothetical protein
MVGRVGGREGLESEGERERERGKDRETEKTSKTRGGVHTS